MIERYRSAAWRQQAKCLGVNVFESLPEAQQKDFCKSCPVMAECLKFALDNETIQSTESMYDWPVYGGLTGHERQVILRERKANARGVR